MRSILIYAHRPGGQALTHSPGLFLKEEQNKAPWYSQLPLWRELTWMGVLLCTDLLPHQQGIQFPESQKNCSGNWSSDERDDIMNVCPQDSLAHCQLPSCPSVEWVSMDMGAHLGFTPCWVCGLSFPTCKMEVITPGSHDCDDRKLRKLLLYSP